MEEHNRHNRLALAFPAFPVSNFILVFELSIGKNRNERSNHLATQQYKGPGKKIYNIHSRSSLDLVEWAAFRTID